ncbi:hypothetical protein BDV09DRAFT_14305 [Aspergillus tetrazonus]
MALLLSNSTQLGSYGARGVPVQETPNVPLIRSRYLELMGISALFCCGLQYTVVQLRYSYRVRQNLFRDVCFRHIR